MQSKTMSFLEVTSGKVVGFLLAMAMTFWIMPHVWGVPPIDIDLAFYATAPYTALAFVRSYAWRRLFNYFMGRKST